MSGVAIVNQLLFVFNLTIFGGLAGASIFGAQFYGKGDHKGVRYALRFKLIFSVLMAVIAIVALLFFNNPLISLFLTGKRIRRRPRLNAFRSEELPVRQLSVSYRSASHKAIPALCVKPARPYPR